MRRRVQLTSYMRPASPEQVYASRNSRDTRSSVYLTDFEALADRQSAIAFDHVDAAESLEAEAQSLSQSAECQNRPLWPARSTTLVVPPSPAAQDASAFLN